MLKYLPALLMLDPECYATNVLAARTYNEDKAYDRALPFTETLVRAFPELPTGYELKADALLGLNAYEPAIASYDLALQRPGHSALYKKVGLAYLGLHQYDNAYRVLRRSFDLFSIEATIDNLYQLGSTAVLAGQKKEAEAILSYLYKYRIPANATEWLQKVKQELARLGVDAEKKE